MGDIPPPTDTDFRQIIGDTFYIYATKLDLTQDDIPYSISDGTYRVLPSPYHIRIQADTVNLNGTVMNRGKDITIVARRIVVTGRSTIDVSGPNPPRDFEDGLPATQVDTTPGAPGTDGKPGDDGLPAGNINLMCETLETILPWDQYQKALTLIANGGRGGRGQTGATGMQGSVGAEGDHYHVAQRNYPAFNVKIPDNVDHDAWRRDNIFSNGDPYGNYFGKTGGPGGAGGSGGRSGKGGNGGSITMGVILSDRAMAPNRQLMASESTDVFFAGGEGLMSTGGQGGPGGSGGLGAIVGCQQYSPDGSVFAGYFGGRTRSGAQGPQGPNGADQMGETGSPGSTDVPGYYRNYRKFAPLVDVELLQLTQRAAKLGYLNAGATGDYTTPAAQFRWLSDITQPILRDDRGRSPEDVQVLNSIHDSANVELTRLSQGLDYYGHASTWAPTLTMQFLTATIDSVMPLGLSIEDDYKTFLDQAKSAIDRSNAYQNTKARLTATVDHLTAAQPQLQMTIDLALKGLQLQYQAIGLQQERINQAKDVFDANWASYVSTQTKCTFGDVFEAIKAIVTLGVTAYDGIGDISDAFGAVKALEGVDEDLTKFQSVIEKIQKVTGDIDSISKGWTSVKGSVTIDKPDAAKLIIKQEDFDKTIAPYLKEIPAAATLLKEAVDHYIDLIKGRNTLLLNYNSLCIKRAELEKQVTQRLAELNRVDAQFKQNQNTDFIPPAYLSFIQQAYNSVRDYLVWLIYEEARAYEYWSLTDQPLDLSDVKISFLSDTHRDLKQSVTDAMTNAKTLNSNFRDTGVVIDRTNNASAFANLAVSKKLNFSVDIHDPAFANHYNIRVSALAVKLSDNVIDHDSKILTLRLHHNGESPFKDQTLAIREFTHEPRLVGFTYDYRRNEITSPGMVGNEKAGYANLSPFTHWTIDFDLSGNEWLDLTRLEQVIITFEGVWEIEG